MVRIDNSYQLILVIILFWQVYFIFSFLHPTESIESPENYEYHAKELECCDCPSYTKKFLSPYPWTDKFVCWPYVFEYDDAETNNKETYKEIHKKKN